jgi:hypothetical protein
MPRICGLCGSSSVSHLAEVEAGRSLLETKTIALDENAPSAKTKEKNAKIEKEEEPEPALTRNAKEEK